MSAVKNLFLVTVLVVVAAVLYPKLFPTEIKVPEIREKWFGKSVKAGQPIPKDPEGLNKFTINVSNETLEDLRTRLQMSRYVTPIEGTNFNYGFNANYLKQLVDYWLKKFDWKKQETILNKYNHFKTQINGINVHYIHVKPTKPAKTIIPIMVIHGWPGSVWEYYKSFPLLTESVNDVAFEVIAPSIPGYGFSDAPQQEGFDVPQAAHVFAKLMKRLKFNRYFVHGGDWGSVISRTMAVLYPENIRGVHLNMNMMPFDMCSQLRLLIGGYFPALVFDEPEIESKKLYPQWERFKFLIRESGYMHIQATKPDTVGAALLNSPTGLLAYIVEKFSTWTDPTNVNKPDGGLTEKFTNDELLTNIMIYWISNNVHSSMRFYKENMLTVFEYNLEDIPVTVPSAVADFPNEMVHSSQTVARRAQFKSLVQFTDMPRGGHFAAFEEPELVCNDIRRFVERVLVLEKAVTDKPVNK